MKTSDNKRLLRISTIFASGFGSASLALWAIGYFSPNGGQDIFSTAGGSIIAGLAALAGAGIAHAYFAGGDDRSTVFEKMMRTDSVTGLITRSGLEDDIPAVMDKMNKHNGLSRAYLISVDFDELREINEVYGSETGDAVLCIIAQRLSNLVGDLGPLARTNGSEFVIALTTGPDEKELRAAMSAITAAISQPVRIGSISYPVYANGGVVEIHHREDKLEKLLRRANLARSNAKKSGRGAYTIYHPEMSHQASYRQWIETEFSYAMQRGEFSLNYQPQFHVPSKKIIVYEALVRWMHRDKGAISPGEFIAVAESCGFIRELGTWILRQACHDAAKMNDDVTISVNVSTSQIEEEDFIRILMSVLAETRLPPHRLELEVTESVLIRDHTKMRRLFRDIKDLGISIAIDDFGTGYSNLTNLSELEFDKIKIDKSFIDRLDGTEGSHSMVATIISLARSLGAKIVSEGIETEEQSVILTSAGCAIMQGYLYGRPVPIDAIMKQTPPQMVMRQREVA